MFRFGVGNMEHAVPWGLDNPPPCSIATEYTEHDIMSPLPNGTLPIARSGGVLEWGCLGYNGVCFTAETLVDLLSPNS